MAPKSVIHVVTVSWKEDASEADIKAALKGVHTLAKEYDAFAAFGPRPSRLKVTAATLS